MPNLRSWSRAGDIDQLRSMYLTKKSQGTLTPEEEQYFQTNYPDIAQEVDIKSIAKGAGGQYMQQPTPQPPSPIVETGGATGGAGDAPRPIAAESLVPVVKQARDAGKSVAREFLNLPTGHISKELLKKAGVKGIDQFEDWLDAPTNEDIVRDQLESMEAAVRKFRRAASFGMLDAKNAVDFLEKYERGEIKGDQLDLALSWMGSETAYRLQYDPQFRADLKSIARKYDELETIIEDEHPVASFVGDMAGMTVSIGSVYSLIRRFSRVTPFMEKGASLLVRAGEAALQGAATGQLWSSMTMDPTLTEEERALQRIYDTAIFGGIDLAIVLGPAAARNLIEKIKSKASYQEIMAGLDDAGKKAVRKWKDIFNDKTIDVIDETLTELEFVAPEVNKLHKGYRDDLAKQLSKERGQISTAGAELLEKTPEVTKKAAEDAAKRQRVIGKETLEQYGAKLPPDFEKTGNFVDKNGNPFRVNKLGQRVYINPSTGQYFSRIRPEIKRRFGKGMDREAIFRAVYGPTSEEEVRAAATKAMAEAARGGKPIRGAAILVDGNRIFEGKIHMEAWDKFVKEETGTMSDEAWEIVLKQFDDVIDPKTGLPNKRVVDGFVLEDGTFLTREETKRYLQTDESYEALASGKMKGTEEDIKEAKEFFFDTDEGSFFSKVVPAEKEDLQRAGLSGFTQRGVDVANRTSRSKGAVGANAITPKYVLENADKNWSVLDFGAGIEAMHSKMLKEAGFKNVTSHEFGNNFRWFTHNPNALEKKYDVVFGSNVLNVQSSHEMARHTLNQMTGAVNPGRHGQLILNYTKDPRYNPWSPKELESQLMLRFKNVERVGGTPSEPLFRASELRPGWKDIEAVANQTKTESAWVMGSDIQSRAVKPIEEHIEFLTKYVKDNFNPKKDDLQGVRHHIQMLREGLISKTGKYPHLKDGKIVYSEVPAQMKKDLEVALKNPGEILSDKYQASTTQVGENFDPVRFANSLVTQFLKKSKQYKSADKAFRDAARQDVKNYAATLEPGAKGFEELRHYMDKTWGVKMPNPDALMTEVYYKELLGAQSAFKSPEARKSFVDFIDEVVQQKDFLDEVEAARKFYNSLSAKDQALMQNSKTLMSLDFSLICPMKEYGILAKGGVPGTEGKICPYCYVFNGRVAKKLGLSFMEGKAETPFLPFQRELIENMPDVWRDFLNTKGGLRVHSFGDFMPDFLPMYEELIDAASKKGLKLKFITKQKRFLDEVVANPLMDGNTIQAQISVDFLPREVTNAPTLEQAKEWIAKTIEKRKAKAEELGVRYTEPQMNLRTVVTNDNDILLSMDPMVKVVTGYHGATGEGLYKTWELANPTVIKNLGPEKARELSESFREYTKGTKRFEMLKKKFPDEICCATKGGCATCKTCCGFQSAFRMAIMTVDDVTPADLAKTFILAHRDVMSDAEYNTFIKLIDDKVLGTNEAVIEYLSKNFPRQLEHLDFSALAPYVAKNINPTTPRTKGFHEAKNKLREMFINPRTYVELAEDLPGVTLSGGKFKGPAEAIRKFPKKLRYHLEKIDNFSRRYANEVVAISKKYKVTEEEVLDQISNYAVAEHAPAYNAANGPRAAKLTTPEWIAVRREIDAMPHGAEIKRMAGILRDINDNNLKMLVKAGRISPETYNMLKAKYPNYVPMQRDFTLEMEHLGLDATDIKEYLSQGSELNPKAPWTYRAVGSEREINDIAVNTITQSIRTMQIAEKNLATQEIFRFVEQNPQFSFVKVKTPTLKPEFVPEIGETVNVLKYPQGDMVQIAYFDGKPKFMEFTDPVMAEAFKQTNKFPFTKWLGPVGKVGRYFANMATQRNPAFPLPNAIRDAQEIFLYVASQNGIEQATKTLSRIPPGYKTAWKYMQEIERATREGRSPNLTGDLKQFDLFVRSGSLTGGMASSTKEQIQTDLMKEIKRAGRGKFNPKRMARFLLRHVEQANEAIENGARFGVFDAALKSGKSIEEASTLASTASIDFNQVGTYGTLMNGLYIFSNASIQGTAKMVKAFIDKPALAAATLVGLESTAAMFHMSNSMIYPGWEDVVPEWDRDNNLIIVLPSTDEDIKYVKVPVSWGIKPFWTLANESIKYATGKKKMTARDIEDSASNLVSSTWNAANPLGGENFLQSITPTIFDLPVDLYTNIGWYGKPLSKPQDYKEKGKYKDLPNYLWQWSYTKNTPAGKAFKEAARIMWIGTLGEDVENKSLDELSGRRGAINLTPDQIQYAFNALTSGPGKFASRTVDQISSWSKGSLSLELNPVLSRFYSKIDKERVDRYKSKAEQEDLGDLSKYGTKQAMLSYQTEERANEFYTSYSALDDPKEQYRFLLSVEKSDPPAHKKLMDIIRRKEKTNQDPLEAVLSKYSNPIKEEVLSDYFKTRTAEEADSVLKNLYRNDVIDIELYKKFKGLIKTGDSE